MSAFVLNRQYELQLPKNFSEVDKDEMEYIEGGSAKDWAIGITCGLIANALWAIGKKAITSAMVKVALTACAGAAKAVWAGISAAAFWVWNTPVALAILAGVVGIGVGVVITYFALK